MKLQHLKLKVQQLQDEIAKKHNELSKLHHELINSCPHTQVVRRPFRSGVFLDRDELRVCEFCGSWELGTSYKSILKPTRDEINTDETLYVRERLTRFSTFGELNGEK